MNADDPLVAKLARFTPANGGLDRDELLFRAGRASVRPNRVWKVVAGILAATLAALLLPAFPMESRKILAPVETPPADPGRDLLPSSARDWELTAGPVPVGPTIATPEPPLLAGWQDGPFD